MHAISEGNGSPVVDRARYIGCGLRVTGCPGDAARLERKPEGEIIHPPADFAARKHERLHNGQPADEAGTKLDGTFRFDTGAEPQSRRLLRRRDCETESRGGRAQSTVVGRKRHALALLLQKCQ